ncbi:hypothetical protein RhiirA1_452005 [Rhizophagus irregularis]|uniref:Uncharacterized protein n=1 Tax=Rhizophagus irregularis TaxID=588596 RepID=A0A2N0SAT5_9GLOM|nr:hypothetical protein RhiirA1_452005 [Rhizophagus irregularis]
MSDTLIYWDRSSDLHWKIVKQLETLTIIRISNLVNTLIYWDRSGDLHWKIMKQLETLTIIRISNLVNTLIYWNRSSDVCALEDCGAIRNLTTYYGAYHLNSSNKISDFKKLTTC